MSARLRALKEQARFKKYRGQAINVTSTTDLLPGLNDILDAFEALPSELVRYMTLLKEIDAKCVGQVPRVNLLILEYIESLHGKSGEDFGGLAANQDNNNNDRDTVAASRRATILRIRNGISDIIPCLEEKMHVTSVAADLLGRHLGRINNDYDLIVETNEIPQLIRVGPLNHPAMIMDASADNSSAADRLAQAQRSESRREALAARKANKEDHNDDRSRAHETLLAAASSALVDIPSAGPGRKRVRREENGEPENTRDHAATGPALPGPSHPGAQRKRTKVRRDERPAPEDNAALRVLEPTYCYCNQVSFGEMVGCDGEDCKREWFHLPCIGYKNPPKGKWFCDDCLAKNKKKR